MKINFRKNSLLVAAAVALLVNHATVATWTWAGANNTSWGIGMNWSEGTVPTAANTTDIIMSNPGNQSFIRDNRTIRSLTFTDSSDGFTQIALYRAFTAAATSQSLTFSSDSGNATLTVESGSTGDKMILRTGSLFSDVNLTSSLYIIHNGSGTLSFGGQMIIKGAGGINKSGTDTLSLQGSNISTSVTSVSSGCTLAGTGTLGALTIQSTGIFAPGDGGIESLNTGDLTLDSGSISNFEINATLDTSDLAISSALLAFGGTLNVTNIGGSLVINDTFNLFDWNTTAGTFTAINLPSLDPGLSWNTEAFTRMAPSPSSPSPTSPRCSVASLLSCPGTLVLLRRRRPSKHKISGS
jgi:hypothetical protein